MSVLSNNTEKIENAPIKRGAVILQSIKTEFKSGNTEPPISMGYSSIDKYYRGFKKNQIVILGGRSSMGKTNFALNVCYNLLKARKKILYIDLEEQQEENLIRLATIHQQFVFKDYLDTPNIGEYKKKEVEKKLNEAEKWLNNKDFYYINKPNLRLSDIKEIVQRYKPLDLIVIDHLTKIKSDAYGNRYEKVTDVANNLRGLSAELGGVPLLIPAQINRESIKGQKTGRKN